MQYISKRENYFKSEVDRVKNNEQFIKTELVNLKVYFDNLFKDIDDKILLDEQQRIAILTDEDYNMIIAGAGSGKTTTISAKVKYLIDIKKVNPKDIVIISFTNKAVDELKQRINKDLGVNCLITTFHKFGLLLLNDKNIRIISDCYDILKEYVDEKLCSDNKVLKLFIKKFNSYFNIPFMALRFKSLNNYFRFIKKLIFLILRFPIRIYVIKNLYIFV